MLQSDTAVRAEDTVREISPILDLMTDTVTVKVTIADTPAAVTLNARPATLLPWSALFEANGKPTVWVVDDKLRVSLRAVTVAEYRERSVVLKNGLAGPERVVPAGRLAAWHRHLVGRRSC